ncbi:LytTR family DNA-binding domain-containing protein [Phenylobacterium sp.]|uniref:LytTR family DNA-binding domain-containing protein n=1 Tax=Phenylobacterium sp. TaxID=1871053 RepID=UPI00121FD439|nr:LytTR family DNA-binding domain-containing protein [Phenylobacterium sp.]THD64872.1 MAG: LytTR family transcriptional regulator [Phenylobacterium sp.]
MSQAEDREDTAPGRIAPDPAGDRLFIAVTAAVLAVVLMVNALNVNDEHLRAGSRLVFWEPFVWEGSSGIYLVAVSPLVMALTRRFWLGAPPRAAKLAAHAAGALIFSVTHMVLIGVMRAGVYAMAGGRYDPWGPLHDWAYEGRKDLLIYATSVALYSGWRTIRGRAPGVSAAPEVLEVRDGARRHFVPLDDVVWVEAAGNYVELHRGGAGLLHRASLSAMEKRLQTAGFVRIHRSRLVRRKAVAAVDSKPTGDFVVRLRDGRELAGSRRYRRPLLAD